ncbi:unnamed protein product [Triticum turgidum subsp. durum]|uniref:Uncharacterized protein n=1 Tax=Triticum turgidum subsp. durum TaxID=4567 RepID=A0A9R1NHJ7_TRITD|nr:unnamed protein product [Triticum turgidum subsp. durum]
MAPLTSKLCWRSCCHRQPEDASCASTVLRVAPGTAAGPSRSLSMKHEPHGTVLLPARQLVLLRQDHEYHDADEHTYRALAGEDDVGESREPPAGGGQLTEVPELGADGGFR